MLEELRKAEQAHQLLSEVERRLAAGNTGASEAARAVGAILARGRLHKIADRIGRGSCQDAQFDEGRLGGGQVAFCHRGRDLDAAGAIQSIDSRADL
jgi:hypothetical protein